MILHLATPTATTTTTLQLLPHTSAEMLPHKFHVTTTRDNYHVLYHSNHSNTITTTQQCQDATKPVPRHDQILYYMPESNHNIQQRKQGQQATANVSECELVALKPKGVPRKKRMEDEPNKQTNKSLVIPAVVCGFGLIALHR